MTVRPSPAASFCGLALLACSTLGLAGRGFAQSQRHDLSAVVLGQAGAKPKKLLVFIGRYTRPDKDGIHVLELDLATGKLKPLSVGPDCVDPSFLAVSPNHHSLYAVNEVNDFQGGKSGGITAFSLNPKTGALTKLNEQSTVGTGPCFVAVDHSGKVAMVANYDSGSFAAFPIHPDGTLGEHSAFIQDEGHGPDKARQEAPHGHSINVDPSNQHAYGADLGLDKVMIFKLDPAKGTLTPNKPAFAEAPPASGPRHLSFHPNGKFAYVIEEMKQTITAYRYDAANGGLHSLQTVSSLAPGYHEAGNSTAAIIVHPSGKFLYGSNRGHNTIAIFRINEETGMLTYVGEESSGGKVPRDFNVDPTGQYLLTANQDSGNVAVFKINQENGKLTPTGQSIAIPKACCVKFVPLGG